MPDSSAIAGGSSDDEIIFRKKTVHKFVDSDEESISRTRTTSPIISGEIENEKPEDTVRTKCRRRVIRRSESESDDEARVLTDKTNLSSDHLDINGQVTESNDENNSIFGKLKTKRKLNRKRDVVASSEEKPAQAKPLFADKDLYDAETSEEERQLGEGPNTSEGYSSIPKAQDPEDEENSAVRSSIESKLQGEQKQNKVKSLFNDKDLYDAESSEEESRKEDNSNLYDADGSGDENSLVTSRKSKSKSHKEKKKKSKKGALTEVDNIHSETQRMVRESRVSLPYHRPKQRTLAEFLQRRPSTPSITKAVRMSVEQLAAMEKQLKERAKQAEEFYKSSSEEEEPEKQQSAGAKEIIEGSLEKESGKQEISAESLKSLEVPFDGGSLSNSVCGESSLLDNKDKLLGHEEHLPLLCHEDVSITGEKVISQANEVMTAAVPSETLSFLKDDQTPKFNTEVNNTGGLTPPSDKKDAPLSSFNEDNSAEIETSTTFKSNVKENESMNTSGVGKTFSISECSISGSGAVKFPTPFESSVSFENSLGEFVDNSENITDTLTLLEDASISQSIARPKDASDDSMPLSLKFQDDSGIPDCNNVVGGKGKWLKNHRGLSFFVLDRDESVNSSEKTKPKMDTLGFNPFQANSEDMLLHLSENIIDDSSMVPVPNCSEGDNSKKYERFSFKKNLSELLWKESWNTLSVNKSEGEKTDSQESNQRSRSISDSTVNDAERAKIMLEGDDARSMCSDILNSVSFEPVDSNNSKSEQSVVRENCGQQSLRMMLEGEDAVSMTPVDEKKTNILTENDDESKSQHENTRDRSDAELPNVVLEGEDARSTLDTLKEKEIMSESKIKDVLETSDKQSSGIDDKLYRESESASNTENRNVAFGIQNEVDNTEESFSICKTPEMRAKREELKKENDTSNSLFFSKILCGGVLPKDENLNEKTQDSSLNTTPANKFIPRLTGSPNKLIDLDSTPSSCGVLALMNRFLKHSTMKKPKPEPKVVDIGIVTAEQGENGEREVKKESISVFLDTEETVQPGAKLQLLKKQLALQMAQQREQEWLKKQQESQLQSKEEKEPDEKSECGILDDEEELLEEDITSSESEEEDEEEEEEEERRKIRSQKSRIQSAFVDDEAEVSEDGVDYDDDGDDEREISSDEDEDDTGKNDAECQKADDETTSSTDTKVTAAAVDQKEITSELKRSRTFDIFGSQDAVDKDEDEQSALEDADIPPYQIGGALTPMTQPAAEERFAASICKPPLRPGLLKGKDEANSVLFPLASSPTPEILGLCSETGTPSTGNAADKEIEAELLGLCSGKFLTQPVEPSQDGEVSQQSQEDSLAPSLISESLPDTQPIPLDVNTNAKRSLKVLLSSDEEDDNLDEKSQKKTKKFHRKLKFSDDENEEESEQGSEEEGDDEPTLVEYDSEENEVVVSKESVELPRLAKDFFEDEAELSESEWDSADEDERDLDTLDVEEGDAENLDQKQIKEQLGKIHMRRILDEDQQEVRRLQELYLEDGELHSEGGGRQRQFRWKNLSIMDDFSENKGPSDDEGVGYGDDEEDEQEWRRMRFARESFLHEQKEKVVTVETTEVDFAEKLKLRLGRTQAQSQPLRLQTKRGSFLARSESALARIAQLTRSVSDSGVLAPTNSRNFVFATISPEKKAAEDNSKITKRKISAPSLPMVKKPRLSEGLLDRLGF